MSSRRSPRDAAGPRGPASDQRSLKPECAQVRPLLSLLVGGDATAEESDEVRRHTAECAWCASEQARMTWALRALRREVPADRLPTAVAAARGAVDRGVVGDEQMFAQLQQDVLDRVGRGDRRQLSRRQLSAWAGPHGRGHRPWLLPLTLAAAALLMMVLDQPVPVDPVVRTTPGSRRAVTSPANPQWQSPTEGAFTAGWWSGRPGGQLGGRTAAWQGLEGIRNLQGGAVDSQGGQRVVLPDAPPGVAAEPRSPLADRLTEEELLNSLPWLEAGPDGWVIRPGRLPGK